MRKYKFLKPLIFTIVLIVVGLINHPVAWSFIISGIIWDIHYRHEAIDKQHNDANAKMGNRLIDGMKALTDLMRNAFEHIKTNALKIEKLNGKLTENNSKLHIISQSQRRVVGERNKTAGHNNTGEVAGTERTDRLSGTKLQRIHNKSKGVEQIVRDTGDKS